MRDYYRPRRDYIGQYIHDEHNTYFEHGLGYYNIPLTGKCAAHFDHSKTSGISIKTWDHGEKYIGFYHLNKKQGVGLHVWPSGARYYGQFQNNQPDGYGVLETVHTGIKFVGRVLGMTATPKEGQWYKDNIPMSLDELEIDGEGCIKHEDGTVVNAVGEKINQYTNADSELVTRHEEKNIITETVVKEPFAFHYGKRDTTYYGDWIRTYNGHFLSGRYHGKALVHQRGAPDYNVNWILGKPVEFDTYSSKAFETTGITRAIQRRMNRKYCGVYDIAIDHLISRSKHLGRDEKFTIMEFGVGRGDHLKFLKELFPNAIVIGVDLLSPTHEPTTALEKQQVDDLKVACNIPGIKIETLRDAYNSQDIYDLVHRYGKIDLAIHDATHGVDTWSKLKTIEECLDPQRGVLITEEMCSKPDEKDSQAIDWHQIGLARADGWRIWDLRPLTWNRYSNSLVGMRTLRPIDADQLSLYEIK